MTQTTTNLYDDAGRFLAGPQGGVERPAGPWDQNTAPPLPILFNPCAWCEDPAELARLNREYPRQVSHTMCDACSVRFLASIDEKYGAARPGEARQG